MDRAIIERIHQLGGDFDVFTGESVEARLEAISFPRGLQFTEELDMRVDEYISEHRDVYLSDPVAFRVQIEEAFFPEGILPGWGGFAWRHEVFTPLTPGTADEREWKDAGLNFREIRKVVDADVLEFVRMGDWQSVYMFHVCLQDPEANNPTVFQTGDDEVFFGDGFDGVINHGSLLTFLYSFATKDQFAQILTRVMANAQ